MTSRRTASLIYDNISEMLKISQLPPLYLYTLDNWVMPYFVTAWRRLDESC
jgi:hypothetical protein